MDEWQRKCTRLVGIIDRLEHQLREKDERIRDLTQQLRKKVYSDAGTNIEEEEQVRRRSGFRP